MYLMIDNYDSFVYNLACYLEECGEKVLLIRNDKITIPEIEELLSSRCLEGLILSPGPKSPKDCGNCKEILEKTAGKIPILGVCLGHQIIGHVFGASIQKGAKPMHGKVTQIRNNQTGLFEGLPKTYPVTRYHSLVVSDHAFPLFPKTALLWRFITNHFLFMEYSFIPKQFLQNMVMNC